MTGAGITHSPFLCILCGLLTGHAEGEAGRESQQQGGACHGCLRRKGGLDRQAGACRSLGTQELLLHACPDQSAGVAASQLLAVSELPLPEAPPTRLRQQLAKRGCRVPIATRLQHHART